MLKLHQEYGLLSKFEKTGVWWSPCGALKRVSGTVTHEPSESPILSITYESGTHGFSAQNKLDKIQRVYGNLADGKCITLLDFFMIQHKTNSNWISTARFTVNLMLVGNNIAESDELVFESSSAIMRGLGAWFKYEPITEDWEVKEGRSCSPIVRHTARTHFSEYIASAKTRITLENYANLSSNEEQYIYRNIEKLEIRPRSKMGFDWHSKTHFQLVELISLFHTKPLMLTSLVLREKRSKNTKRRIYDPFYSAVYPVNKYNDQGIKANNVIFTFSEVEGRLKRIMERFYALDEGVSTASGMFHALRSRWPSVDIRLIFLVQAYEAAFSNDSKGLYVSTAKYKKIKKSILEPLKAELESCPDLYESIRRSLGYSNSLTLREKMTLQANEMNAKTRKRIFVEEYELVIKGLVETRNHLTHRSVSTRTAAVVFGPSMVNITEVLSWLVWLLVVRSIGLSKVEINEKVISSRTFDSRARRRIEKDS